MRYAEGGWHGKSFVLGCSGVCTVFFPRVRALDPLLVLCQWSLPSRGVSLGLFGRDATGTFTVYLEAGSTKLLRPASREVVTGLA